MQDRFHSATGHVLVSFPTVIRDRRRRTNTLRCSDVGLLGITVNQKHVAATPRKVARSAALPGQQRGRTASCATQERARAAEAGAPVSDPWELEPVAPHSGETTPAFPSHPWQLHMDEILG